MEDIPNFEVRQGQTWTLRITINGADGITPMPLEGAEFSGAVRERPGAEKVAVISCTPVEGQVGKLDLMINDDITAKIPAASSYAKSRTYHLDVKMKLNGVSIYVLVATMELWGGVLIE